METSFNSYRYSNTVVSTEFCTWHDSCAVMACAKIVAIWWPATELQQGEVSIEFDLWVKKKQLVKQAPSYQIDLFHNIFSPSE